MMAANQRSFTLDLPLANILHDPKNEWKRFAQGKTRIARNIEVDWKKFNNDNFLFSHATIVASLLTTDNGYYIEEPTDELVNSNGNAWTNPVLLATFKTFVGGENYLEHCQCPELSKGKILDAVVRPVRYVGKTNKTASDNVYYVDILVATDRKHEDLVPRIATGELATLSMGCIAPYVQCSKCGKVFGDNDIACEHIQNQLLTYFTDENGKRRIVAELCGRSFLKDGIWVGDPNSVKFIEASWVENPAFKGAVINHYISEVPKHVAKVIDFPTDKLQEYMDNIFNVRVADKWGMISLRLAWEEMRRRKHEEMIERVSSVVL